MPERVLVVVAHPDDVDFGCRRHRRDVDRPPGSRSRYCIVTDGDAGGFDPQVPRAKIAGIRASRSSGRRPAASA